MSLLSKLRPMIKAYTTAQKTGALRQMSDHKVFPLEPSRWQWNKFKDHLHFYLLLGIIPCTAFVGYMNCFIGPATLTEIPEDYTPKYWEYYRNPVTRFLTKYLYTDPQQEYEKFLCYIFIEEEKRKLRQIEQEIMAKMAERNDYQAYYFRPVAAKYARIVRESADNLKDNRPEY